MKTRTRIFWMAALCLPSMLMAGQNRQTVALANPDKPAELVIDNISSNIVITAYDGKEVVVDYVLDAASDSLNKLPVSNPLIFRGEVLSYSSRTGNAHFIGGFNKTDGKDDISTEGLKKIKDGSLGYNLKVDGNQVKISNDISFCSGISYRSYKSSNTKSTGAPSPETKITDKDGLAKIKGSGNKSQSGFPGIIRNEFRIKVPYLSNCKVHTSLGNITITGINGEIEANTISGTIDIQNVAGSVVSSAVNGKIKTVLKEIRTDTPMAFSTMNGPIDVTLPAGIKANFKITSRQGDVYTDFDINQTGVSKVNGGGPEINFRSTMGNIYIRKGK